MEKAGRTSFLTRIPDSSLDMYRAEIGRRNLQLIGYLSYFGITVAGLGAISRATLRGGMFFTSFGLLFVYFAFLYLGRDHVARLFGGNAAACLYAVETPVWIIGIVMGTVLDPGDRAVTFFLLQSFLPLFILDEPRRVLSFTAFWCVVFCITAFFIKEHEAFLKDISFLVMFGSASLVTTGLLLSIRLDAVLHFAESERRARRDAVTGLKNRYALRRDMANFFDNELIVALLRIDDLSFFNDAFGHSLGENLMSLFATTLSDTFGSESCYCYTAHELLLVLPLEDRRHFELLLRGSRADFLVGASEQFHVRPSCSVGFVYGLATNEVDVQAMINHADVRLSEASHAGTSQLRGAAFDRLRGAPERLAAELGGNLQSNYLDKLTDLPNMHAFFMRAQNLLNREQGVATPAFLYFDVENFKKYNEQYGFQRGDDLLRGVARVLREAFPNRLVARFSDDHFVVMCNSSELESCLAEALNRSFELHSRTDMPLKAGVYLYEDNSESISTACDHAKAACDSVKNRYDVFWRIYDDELRHSEERRAHILAHVDDAVENDWLRVYYQPIVRSLTREVVECEALVRWIDPTYGFLAPATFIGELERAHLIHKVDLWMVEHVCRDYCSRVREGLSPVPVSVNLSRLDFVLCDVEEELLRITETYEVPPRDLHVEVTESALSEDFAQLVVITNRLREHGFEVWLDDFGSDYSSLTTLKDFPCDVVKLDLMFLRSFEGNKRAGVIIQQVVELARKLGARSLAEGVENPEHLKFLQNVGCDLAQGYLISRPQPYETLVREGLL